MVDESRPLSVGMVDEVLRARVAALGIGRWLEHTALMPPLVTSTAVLARKHHITLRPRMTAAEPGGLRRGPVDEGMHYSSTTWPTKFQSEMGHS